MNKFMKIHFFIAGFLESTLQQLKGLHINVYMATVGNTFCLIN